MQKSLIHVSLLVLVCIFLFIVASGRNTSAATTPNPTTLPVLQPTPTQAGADGRPTFTAYKGITIGMQADEARAKLGPPKEKSDERDYFVFSDNETAQLMYDANHTVKIISVTYIGKIKDAPLPKDVIGSDVEARPDGGMSKVARFPKAGYWVSYVKTGGEDPMVIITLQKLTGDQ